MTQQHLSARLLLALTCGALITGLAACGNQSSEIIQPAAIPLPDGIELSFKRSIFDTNDFLRPYEGARLFINPTALDRIPKDSPLWIDTASRLDGLPIPQDVIQYLQFHRQVMRGQTNAVTGPAFQPWRLFPREPGTYSYDLVLHTQNEKWVCPPLTVEIRASEEEAALLTEFKASGASPFLDHPTGARWTREPEARPLPYDALAGFVTAHPESYLTAIIFQRIWCIHLRDLNSCGPYGDGTLVPEDREALATLLGRMDPQFKESFARFQKRLKEAGSSPSATGQLPQPIEINNEWTRIATAADTEQGATE